MADNYVMDYVDEEVVDEETQEEDQAYELDETPPVSGSGLGTIGAMAVGAASAFAIKAMWDFGAKVYRNHKEAKAQKEEKPKGEGKHKIVKFNPFRKKNETPATNEEDKTEAQDTPTSENTNNKKKNKAV